MKYNLEKQHSIGKSHAIKLAIKNHSPIIGVNSSEWTRMQDRAKVKELSPTYVTDLNILNLGGSELRSKKSEVAHFVCYHELDCFKKVRNLILLLMGNKKIENKKIRKKIIYKKKYIKLKRY